MAKDITFTKLDNGFVLVTGANWRQYTLSPMCVIRIDVQHDLVRIYMPCGTIEEYKVSDVLSITSANGIVTLTNDVVTLFNTLKDVCFDNSITTQLGATNINVDANITNANLEISNDIGNPIPISNQLLEDNSIKQVINSENFSNEIIEISQFQKFYGEKTKKQLDKIIELLERIANN